MKRQSSTVSNIIGIRWFFIENKIVLRNVNIIIAMQMSVDELISFLISY